MSNKNKKIITALVPMRHSSERVPGKNYRLLGGIPLYHHIIKSLEMSGCISQIVIDTDSPFIRSDAAQHFPDVRLIERPEHLRGGEIPMNRILLHDVSLCQADFYLQTHSTNPLLSSESIARAVDVFLENYPRIDSLFSVTALQKRLWSRDGKPINHDPKVLLPTQNLTPLYEENSNIYIFSAESLQECGNRIGRNPKLFEVAPEEAIDIDEEIDFQIAEQMYLIKKEDE